ncbi:MAG TPA: sialate O-acetylesterase [Candidatus Aminicenantes bacterium]|nr:sialate O-acetylesterase [Candidatus Aminicenantes bacterium]HRY64022.1 sialate O-acetylesterase [Candidatus Aminicenantes bacterium]HRZ70935.1 sialate O-acetylesterase [Candidatus Aminicenantes bacterium]
MSSSIKRLAAFAAAGLVLGVLGPGPAAPLAAAVRLPAVIGDHMVLQQEKPIAIWGWAGKGEAVTVLLAGQERKTVASTVDGTWRVVFDALKAGDAPLEMTVRGATGPALAVKDILVGEVWVCSGQSNMEMSFAWLGMPSPDVLRAGHPRLRLFFVPKRTADMPRDDVESRWAACTPDSVRTFSMVAYYFGLELHRRLGVPVGLIDASWGGTRIEPWTPPIGFAAVPEVKPLLDAQVDRYAGYKAALAKSLPAIEAWARDGRKALAARPPQPVGTPPALPPNPFDNPQAPTTLYNGMIHALTPFAIRGAIWYQGEANRDDGLLYETKMAALIQGWRTAWGLGDFPFYYVQLAPYDYGYGGEKPVVDVPDYQRLPLIWEAQRNALRLPNTGMAVVTDIANLRDIHPTNKRDVGYRLSLWARANVYGEKTLVCSGPLYRSMSVDGTLIRLSFDNVGGGLVSNDGRTLTWFEIAGEDRVFYKAEAEIAGDAVVVWSPRVASPRAVRFGWNDLAVPNLANREGLPASPFRTDNW